MAGEIVSPLRDERNILRWLIIGALGISVLLAGIYVVFLRVDRVPLYQNLRPADAAKIVDMLESQGVDVSLADAGTTILVAADEADRLRLDVVSANLPLGGADGFELFNDSDIGLTDFAQRINYQRALQGELARTILMIDGIADVRVHLSVPEKTVFRGERSESSASVTIKTRPGYSLSPASVEGIQELVAGAITDLSPGQIVVLDEHGRIVSTQDRQDDAATIESREQRALEQYYAARVMREIDDNLVGQRIEVIVKTLTQQTADINAMNEGVSGTSEDTIAAVPKLRLTILSPRQLNDDEKAIARMAAATALGESTAAAAQFSFQIGTGNSLEPRLREQYVVPPGSAVRQNEHERNRPSTYSDPMLLAGLVVILLGIALAWCWGLLRGRSILNQGERDAFLNRLRERLAAAEPEIAHGDG